ncbi:MAG: hypothetical protein WDO14_13690 [Bacteroidota bacterium]
MKLLFTIVFTIGSVTFAVSQANQPCAVSLVERSYEALGGRSRIDTIRNLQFTGYGHRNLLEQSERPEGPFIAQNFTFRGIADLGNQLFLMDAKDQLFNTSLKFLVDKEAIAFTSHGRTAPWVREQVLQDEPELNPFAILKTALQSNSLICLPDSAIHGLSNRRIQFVWKEHIVRISFNPYTYLYTCIEVQKPYYDYYLNIWGDSRKVVLYTWWDLLGNGAHFPMQKDIYFNGQLWESTLIREMNINKPLSADSIRIPENIRTLCLSSKDVFLDRVEKMMSAKSEIAKDVWMIPGYCTATVIRQTDGLTLIEAPHSSGYTDKVVNMAKELYPGVPVKNIITTSDAWLHCGGIRTAALEAPVVALSRNKELLERILKAPYRTEPDRWELEKKKNPVVRYINGRTTLGTGANRVEIIPFNSEAGERMMMVYFPEHKLLYASDLYQPGNWQKHYTFEVIDAIEREKLDVEFVYAMHSPPVKLSEIKKSMEDLLK